MTIHFLQLTLSRSTVCNQTTSPERKTGLGESRTGLVHRKMQLREARSSIAGSAFEPPPALENQASPRVTGMGFSSGRLLRRRLPSHAAKIREPKCETSVSRLLHPISTRLTAMEDGRSGVEKTPLYVTRRHQGGSPEIAKSENWIWLASDPKCRLSPPPNRN